MKPPILTAMSLLLAAGVGGVIGYRVARTPEHSATSRPSNTEVSAPKAPVHETQDGLSPSVLTVEAAPFHWSQVEAPDWKVYIANLRGIGCPERIIRNIIGAEVDLLYSQRHRELEMPPETQQNYWEPRRGVGPKAEYERRLKHRELEREQEALMAELLGRPGGEEGRPGPDRAEPSPNPAAGDPSQLPAEVRAQVRDIQEKYMHLREEVFHQAEGRIYPADAVRLQELQEQRLTELGQVLSPEQLREYELREGPIADQLRHQLEPFQPTEAEFRAIHEVRQSFAAELGYERFDFEDPEYHRAREQVQQQVDQQLQSVLGEERFAEYQQAMEPHFRDLYALAGRFELPAENVNEMYGLWRTSEQLVDQVHGSAGLGPEQKHQILQVYRDEVESQARQILGDAAYYNYSSRGGEWMRHMFGE